MFYLKIINFLGFLHKSSTKFGRLLYSVYYIYLDTGALAGNTSSEVFIHPAVFLVVPTVLCLLLLILTVLFVYKRLKSSQKKRREKRKIRHDLGDNLSAQPLTDDCSIEVILPFRVVFFVGWPSPMHRIPRVKQILCFFS